MQESFALKKVEVAAPRKHSARRMVIEKYFAGKTAANKYFAKKMVVKMSVISN
jgi:hypothetical protein